jgi:hypothetical protein
VSVKLTISPEDLLWRDLFEDSKHFLELATKYDKTDQRKARTYIRASIITAFAALETVVNLLLDFVGQDEESGLAESAFAQERTVELAEEGYLKIGGQKFRSLKQKVKFVHWRAKRRSIAKDSAIWRSFLAAEELRHTLVHPKPGKVSYVGLTVSAARACLTSTAKLSQMLGGPAINLGA